MPVKPSEKEEEYFVRLEAERLKKIAEEKAKKLAADKRRKQKELHWMHCPKCGMELQTVTYKEIEVDRCFHCHGMWLDAGESEKLVKAEKSKGVTLGAISRLFQ